MKGIRWPRDRGRSDCDVDTIAEVQRGEMQVTHLGIVVIRGPLSDPSVQAVVESLMAR
jgi:hypothetical protein